MERGSRRTRSQAAPEWTKRELLTLVNEIKAVKAECGGAMSSFQMWQLVVEHCNALDVNRSMDQCRRKLDSLRDGYMRIKPWRDEYWTFNADRKKKLELPESFDREVFDTMYRFGNSSAVIDEGQVDSDAEADDLKDKVDVSVHFPVSGLKKPRGTPRKRKTGESSSAPVIQEAPEIQHSNLEKNKGKGPRLDDDMEILENQTTENIDAEQSDGDMEILENQITENIDAEQSDGDMEIPENQTTENIDAEQSDDDMEIPENRTTENIDAEQSDDKDKLETMASNLQEQTEFVNKVLVGNLPEYSTGATTATDLVRLQADDIIDSLGSISKTLSELCGTVQGCN